MRWAGLAEEYRSLGKLLIDQFECLAPTGWQYTHVLSDPTASCNPATPTACRLTLSMPIPGVTACGLQLVLSMTCRKACGSNTARCG